MTDYKKQIKNLKECYRGLPNERYATFIDMANIAESLLTELTAIREATDEDVEECAREAENGIGTDWYGDRKGCQNASEYLEKLKDIAISRGQRVKELEERMRG